MSIHTKNLVSMHNAEALMLKHTGLPGVVLGVFVTFANLREPAFASTITKKKVVDTANES